MTFSQIYSGPMAAIPEFGILLPSLTWLSRLGLTGPLDQTWSIGHVLFAGFHPFSRAVIRNTIWNAILDWEKHTSYLAAY